MTNSLITWEKDLKVSSCNFYIGSTFSNHYRFFDFHCDILLVLCKRDNIVLISILCSLFV